jgi:tryptophan 2-monooxygenase
MTVLTNPIPKVKDANSFTPLGYIDTLYDYVAFLAPGNTPTPIGTLPQSAYGSKVAIIGAGMAGLVAAFELLKVGIIPVIFEASDRVGGRAASMPFIDNGEPSTTDFAELGSMRFPPSGRTFFYYVNQFGLPTTPKFPDPGKVMTAITYQNQTYIWEPGPTPPGPFAQLQTDWGNFVNSFVTPLNAAWQQAQSSGDYSKVIQLWQAIIDDYKDVSFYEALRQGIPSWTDDQVAMFGALGIGSGGFGPLYQVNFLELMRIVVNQWEDNQELLPGGISSLAQAFYNTKVSLPGAGNQSLASLQCVNFNTPVTSVTAVPDTGMVNVVWGGASPGQVQFQAVIVATTTRSMEVMGMTIAPANNQPLTQPVRSAIRNIHLMDSSKLFIRTATKFWKLNPNLNGLANIQTDELPRGVYCLDYPQTDHGIVLISYVWGDDSSKLLPMGPAERLELFKSAIGQTNDLFAYNLQPMNGESDIIMIDWENEDFYYGAFKLQYPGQEPNIAAAYYQFQTVGTANDTGVYLAGDSVSWSGGWTEGALQTGINAACAVIAHIGGQVNPKSPLTQNANMYNYSSTPSIPRGAASYQTPALGTPVTK